jgi:hypothetical protein
MAFVPYVFVLVQVQVQVQVQVHLVSSLYYLPTRIQPT